MAKGGGYPISHRPALRNDLDASIHVLGQVLPQIVHAGRQCRLELDLMSFVFVPIAIRPALPLVDVDHFLVVEPRRLSKRLRFQCGHI
jgi:hypothetical protein